MTFSSAQFPFPSQHDPFTGQRLGSGGNDINKTNITLIQISQHHLAHLRSQTEEIQNKLQTNQYP